MCKYDERKTTCRSQHKFNYPNVFLKFSSFLVTKFGRNLTRRDNTFIMSSSSFDCDKSPDASTLGLWDLLRPNDDKRMVHFSWHPQVFFKSATVERGKCNRSLDACLDAPGLSHRTLEPDATNLPMPRHQRDATSHSMPGLGSSGL